MTKPYCTCISDKIKHKTLKETEEIDGFCKYCEHAVVWKEDGDIRQIRRNKKEYKFRFIELYSVSASYHGKKPWVDRGQL